MKKYFILFTILYLILTISASAQNNTKKTHLVPYSKQEKAKSDTIVKVERKKPGTAFGNFLFYLSPNKYEMVDSSYPVVIDSSFYIRESNHVVDNQRNKNDNLATNEEYWNQIYNIDETLTNKPRKDSLSKVIIGYHPYWMGTAYKSYDFTLLSRVAYFAYEVNPTNGTPKTIHFWKKTGLKRQAHHNQRCKVDLCVTNFGQTNNRKFFSNQQAQDTLIKRVIQLLAPHITNAPEGGDGVNINFEAVPKQNKKDFSDFIAKFKKELLKANKNYKLTVTIPAIDWRNAYDVAALQEHVDYFFVMGYDFYGKYSTVAGPNSLLYSGSDWTESNINTTINNYIEMGADPSSIILGLPYYGNEWVTKDGSVPSEQISFRQARSYSYINNNYDKYKPKYDSTSHSIYYVFKDENDNNIQCWTENEQTLAIKYDYINEKKLGGLGIWALGYDNGYQDLWNLIEEKFTDRPDTLDLHAQLVKTLEYDVTNKALRNINRTTPEYTKRFAQKIKKFWHILILFFGIILTFAIIGFIVAITDFDVRFVLFNKEIRVYMFFIVLAFVTLLILRITGLLQNNHLVLIISLIFGVSIALILLKVGNIKKDKSGEEKP